MLSRTLMSLLTTAAVGCSILAAPAQAAPASSSLVDLVQKEEVPGPFTQHSYHIFPKVPKTFAPLKPTVPTGTTLTLEEGAELEKLVSRGWSLSITDNVMTVTAPGSAEGYCAIPALINHADGSQESLDLLIYVDYMIDMGFPGSVVSTLMSSSPRPVGGSC